MTWSIDYELSLPNLGLTHPIIYLLILGIGCWLHPLFSRDRQSMKKHALSGTLSLKSLTWHSC
jgi:hypothetical protein